MRVAFLSSEYPPHVYGGLGTTVAALSRALAARGVAVTLLVPDAPGYADPPPGVSLLPVPVGGAGGDTDYWLGFCESARDVAVAAGLRVDAVHAHDWMTAPGGLAVGRALGAPVLLTVHLPQLAAENVAYETLGLAGAGAVLVNSLAVRDELAARETVAPAPVVVVPNGVDLDRFTPGGPAPDPHRILFAGRLVPQKGVDVLLRAFGAVLRRHPDATLHLAGDGQLRLYLQRLARFLGVSGGVHFLGWRGDDLPALYRSAAVTAVPSLYEPFGLVALEAMASGCPVVASRVGGLAEIVDGTTVVPGDHLDLATRLVELLSDPDLARSRGAAARGRAEAYDWAVVADRTVAVYADLATRGPGAPLGHERIGAILSTVGEGARARLAALLS